MTEQTFQEIRNAIELIQKGAATKMQGKNWTVYKMAQLVRIDIREE